MLSINNHQGNKYKLKSQYFPFCYFGRTVHTPGLGPPFYLYTRCHLFLATQRYCSTSYLLSYIHFVSLLDFSISIWIWFCLSHLKNNLSLDFTTPPAGTVFSSLPFQQSPWKTCLSLLTLFILPPFSLGTFYSRGC